VNELSQAQLRCLPAAISGSNIICQAKSGEGKTTLFVLAILQQLILSHSDQQLGPTAIIICNTRALAQNTGDMIKGLAEYCQQINVCVLVGTVPIGVHRKMLSSLNHNVSIIVGTPGRILQLCREKILSLELIKHFVIDNADKVLNWLGTPLLSTSTHNLNPEMRSDVQEIFKLTPKYKQVMTFACTDKTQEVCRKFMKDPFEYLASNSEQQTVCAEEDIDIIN